MKRFFITLAYNGKNYVGWQVQPNGMSVQQKMQEALSTLLRKPIGIVGAGVPTPEFMLKKWLPISIGRETLLMLKILS